MDDRKRRALDVYEASWVTFLRAEMGMLAALKEAQVIGVGHSELDAAEEAAYKKVNG